MGRVCSSVVGGPGRWRPLDTELRQPRGGARRSVLRPEAQLERRGQGVRCGERGDPSVFCAPRGQGRAERTLSCRGRNLSPMQATVSDVSQGPRSDLPTDVGAHTESASGWQSWLGTLWRPTLRAGPATHGSATSLSGSSSLFRRRSPCHPAPRRAQRTPLRPEIGLEIDFPKQREESAVRATLGLRSASRRGSAPDRSSAQPRRNAHHVQRRGRVILSTWLTLEVVCE